MKKYYATFNEDGTFERIEHLENISSFRNFNSRDIFEITQEQAENARYLSLVDGKVQFDTVAYMASQEEQIDAETSSLISADAPNEFELINDLLIKVTAKLGELTTFNNTDPDLKKFNEFITRRETIKASQQLKKDALGV